jgi:hypothetical protein
MRGRRGAQSQLESLADMFGGTRQSTHGDGGSHWQIVKDYLLPLGTVMIAALALLKQDLGWPRAGVIGVALYLAFAVAVTLYRPVRRMLVRSTRSIRLRRVRRDALPRIASIVARIKHSLDTGYSDTLLHAVREAGLCQEVRSQAPLLYDADQIETLRCWVGSLGDRLPTTGRQGFVSLCAELGHFMNRYNTFFCQRQRELQNIISSGTLPALQVRSVKQFWNVQRESHARLVLDWLTLGRTVNEISRQQLCLEYYEQVGTLE